jgi:[NiFe] hydrogenase assembly HybE family chaperone
MPDMSNSPDIPRLEAAFRALDARMGGAPGYNPALSVVAAGFRPWREHWLGAVIVPWAIQLVLLPGGDEGSEPPALPGERRTRHLPVGERTLMGLDLEGYGRVETAPLLASAQNFATQGEAESAALVALAALMLPEGTPVFESKPAEHPPTAREAITSRPLSRRNFLRGRLFGR